MLAIFDVEGVLYDAEYLPILAKEVDKDDEIMEITKKGIRGEIDWEQGLQTRVDELKGINFSVCQKVADSLPIMKGAIELCRELKDTGWKIMAVSGGFTIMTDRLQKILGLDYVFSNNLLFKEKVLDGVDIKVGADKSLAAKIKIEEWGEEKEDIVVIVDGANDLKLLNLCGLSIAYRAQDVVKKLADHIVDEHDLYKVLPIIKKHYKL